MSGNTSIIETRYGLLGCGAQTVTIGDVGYSANDLLVLMGLNFDDSRAIDVIVLSQNLYAFRYYDGQDQRVVAVEFDAAFRVLRETREWLGGDESFPRYCGH